MKDAKGHGSDSRGGMARVSVNPNKLGFRIADIGPGGKEHNVQTGGAWDAAHEARYQSARARAAGSNHNYSREAVNNAIASSNRAGRRISGKEAKMIHALLKGRHG